MKETERKEEKLAGGEIVIRNRLFTWLDNFWYHYKWHVIVVAFFVLVSAICFVQCGTKNKTDATVTFAGGYTLTPEERTQILDVLAAIAPEKADGTGRMSLALNTYSIYTEEELKTAYTDPNTNTLSSYAYNNAKQVNADHYKTFSTYVMTGEGAVWLVSEYVYQSQGLDTRAMPLKELFGDDLPQGAYDACAIRLADTELYRYYDALKILPEDTLILFPRSTFMGASSDKETYAEFERVYRAIVEFRVP